MRPIDADSLKAQLIYFASYMQDNGHSTYAAAIGEAINIVDRRQTIDAVPVVRCGDCRWYDSAFYACSKCGVCVNRDFYCADGERSDDHEPCP